MLQQKGADEGDNLRGNPNKYILKGDNKLSQGRKYLPTGIVCKTVTGTDYTNWGPSMAWCS